MKISPERSHAVLTAAFCLAIALLFSGSGAPPGESLAANATTPADDAAAKGLRAVDGGAGFYGGFENPLPATPDYFPLGVWLESVLEPGDIEMDKSVGLNTYVNLTANSDTALLQPGGVHAVTSEPSPWSSGLVLADEPDMWAGPGSSKWTGKWPGQGEVCNPAGVPCGYSVQRKLSAAIADGTMTYANYGKGVSFWETDEEASVFVNEFQDVVSVDNYWFTDPNICGQGEGGGRLGGGRNLTDLECRLGANYGWTVDRVRSLVRPAGSKPVWAFVELGHPAGEAKAPTITGPQIRAAVWSSLIHGARGIVYFNHSFGGPCQSFHILRESCGDEIRPWVTSVNQQITVLAPVLNAPFLDGALTRTAGVDTAVKVLDGDLYIFAGSAQAQAQHAELTLGCLRGADFTAAVLDEDRTVHVSNGTIRDTFKDGNAVHLYRINGAAASCLP
ncbi:hypothetical protein QK292_10620 [Arthrobacter sp. AL08]|uniref:hypothetical protein n=1 Tax=Micrococcaceae TaxID=1268 RepID=UPI00249C3900|nr:MULTISPECIES: hypothetical protein [Micrococcaceae]MDI3242033.1 hypothetical protein [Arthrobacter sp. AL05]MDI3278027.1 hypothetical protein [Arthrobacter sp. AL08]MDJ0352541.1 hypothetical protein [Pseudarthrobacter sp. PH31-O2]